MAVMVLVGGELDGKDFKKISAASRPEVFYAVPALDEGKIRNAKGNVAKSELRQRLSVLAYKYDPEKSTKDRFHMVRCPELDKVRH